MVNGVEEQRQIGWKSLAPQEVRQSWGGGWRQMALTPVYCGISELFTNVS
jgi:hypothetical protein